MFDFFEVTVPPFFSFRKDDIEDKKIRVPIDHQKQDLEHPEPFSWKGQI
jgi:hypothetical protein